MADLEYTLDNSIIVPIYQGTNILNDGIDKITYIKMADEEHLSNSIFCDSLYVH